MSPSTNTKQKSTVVRVIKWAVLIWFIGKIAGCCLMIPGPWGPKVEAELSDGNYIAFQSRSIGRETDDRLTWINSQGVRKDFWVDQVHAGFEHVVLKLCDDAHGVWVESDEKVGASLDLVTGEFRNEQSLQFEWARYGQGKTIAEGQTGSFLQMIVPW